MAAETVWVLDGLGRKGGGEAQMVEDRSMKRASERQGSGDLACKTSRRLLGIR